MRKSGIIAAVVLGIVAFASAPARAALLNPGGTQFPAPGEPDPTGGAIVGTLTSPFSVPGFFTGALVTNVIAGDPSNPFGGLTFTYELRNAANSPNAIARLTVSDYTGFLTDTSYQTPPLIGVAPTFIDRLTADVVGFSFAGFGPGPLFPGTNSALLVVQTNAPAFTNGLASIIDSGAITVGSLAPVPEPASLGLLVAAGVMVLRRRR